MKFLISFCLLSLLMLNPSVGFSQKENLKEVEISGVKYVLHTVKKSETVFSLCQKYKVTQNELKQANPALTALLKAGSTIKIPVGKVDPEFKKEETKAQSVNTEEYYYHKVNKKQTLFSIAKQYGVTANDLIRNNSELTNGLVIGQILKIPVSLTNSDEKSANQSSMVSDGNENLAEYTVHPVVSGETEYSLEKRYGITHEEMLKYNPALQNGLKSGMKLKIPVKIASKPIEPSTILQSFSKYRVEKGETLFSLSSRFGVEANELKKANPSLFSRSLEVGETILIPLHSRIVSSVENSNKNTSVQNSWDSKNVVENEPSNCLPITEKTNQKYKVGLLLPFDLSENNKNEPVSINKELLLSKINFSNQDAPATSDTAIMVNGTNIDQKAEGFLEFYEGTLLAIDSLQRKGMNVELLVFDVSNQQTINALLQMEEFLDLNLIIGPVYPELQESVASFAAKNRIPMVSPLSSSGNFEQNNSYYFKANPSREYQFEQTVTYIADEFSAKNFILLQLSGNSVSPEAKLALFCKEKLTGRSGKNLFHEFNFQKEGVNSIKPLLDQTGENIFFIPTDNEAQVSVAVTNLTALAENYDIVLMGTPAFPKLKSIQTESYHRIRLRYLSPYFIDYSKPLVRRFVGQYRESFSAEPSQFSFQGFDVSYYFLSALYRYGKNFRNCLPGYPMELIQMVFNFRKVAPMGGFMNHGMFVTAYERNFDVLNYGVVGGK